MQDLTQSATLLLIDVQQGFEDVAHWGGARNNPDAERNIARLLEAWRGSGRPVRHVRHDSVTEGSPLRPGMPGNALKREAEPREGEAVYGKSVNSAFIGTTLEDDLRREKVDTVVIVGLTTNHCVSTTARMAANLGFDTVVVSDATATFDRAGLDGETRPAAEVHAGALSDLQGEFATILDTAAVLAAAAARNTAAA